jgi:hypothetical protein
LGEEIMQVIKLEYNTQVPNNYTGIVKYFNGDKAWYLNGKLHREDGPAVIKPDGTKAWLLNGEYYRIDGPTNEYANGTKDWWLNYELLFRLPSKSQPFVLLEEFVDEKGNERIKVLTQEGIEIWKVLPGLKELADNWEKK